MTPKEKTILPIAVQKWRVSKMDWKCKIELNAFELGYLTALLSVRLNEHPEDKDVINNLYQQLRNQCNRICEDQNELLEEI